MKSLWISCKWCSLLGGFAIDDRSRSQLGLCSPTIITYLPCSPYIFSAFPHYINPIFPEQKFHPVTEYRGGTAHHTTAVSRSHRPADGALPRLLKMNLNEDEFSLLCNLLTLRRADVASIGECLRLLDQFGLLPAHLQAVTANLHSLLGGMTEPEVSLVASLSTNQPATNSGLRPNWSPYFPLVMK